MKPRLLAGITLIFLLVLGFSLSFPKEYSRRGVIVISTLNPSPQETPVKKPKYDYMSAFLSRDTSPLGLKEDILLKKLLRQPRIKWAIRASARHILD
jgi:hypothetical protein